VKFIKRDSKKTSLIKTATGNKITIHVNTPQKAMVIKGPMVTILYNGAGHSEG